MYRKVIGICVVLAFMLCSRAISQQFAFRVSFTDKNNTPYSLSTPSAYLSSRAITRRATQGIAIDSTDLPVNRAYIDSVLVLTGGKWHTTSKWLNNCTILLAAADSANINNLTGKAFITEIKLIAYYTSNLHKPAATTADPVQSPGYKTTSFDAAYYNESWVQTSLVRGNYLHSNGFMGQGILIAVFDAGFAGAHSIAGFDSMFNSGRVIDTVDYVRHSNNIFDADSHGADVLSTIAGYAPGSYVGAAPHATFALYRTETGGSDQPIELDQMIAATERADSIGADIISESVGYDVFDYPPGAGQVFAVDLDGKTTVGAKAANFATKKGMLFVATAGNDGMGFGSWGNHILTPGDADSAFTIGSTNQYGVIAASSGYGPNAAGRLKPDVACFGQGANVLIPGAIVSRNGTSISTPQVAGWAACLWQANPNATPYQIKQAIIRCASAYNSPDNHIGYGVPNFQCTQQLLHVTDTPPPFTPTNWVIAAPNPSSGEIKIAVSPNSDNFVEFRLMDVTGKTVLSFSKNLFKGYNTPIVLSLQELPAGIYILKVVSPTQQKVIRLEKI
ncbi:MAG: C-terminal target protein [Flavipsychrobacter sp.]|jgi:hypothetical protein|nr:C-terminal target protein [Flavipsychrobacter sp.]